MTCAFWMWASASAGACLGFMFASMFRVASDADDREERFSEGDERKRIRNFKDG